MIYPYFFLRALAFAVIGFWLVGCASNNYNNQPTVPTYTDPYAQSGVDELLAFGASMANMSEVSRADVCKSLMNTQKISPSNGVQLHLMVARLLSNECGDIPKLLEAVDNIKQAYARDENLQRFIALHTQVLMNLHNLAKRQASYERKQKSRSASNTKEAPEPKKDENRLLREKLEAIRSIEKQMDETSEGN